MRTIFFTLENGKYIADGDGSEITTEMLMENDHLINGNYGSVTIKDKDDNNVWGSLTLDIYFVG